MNGMTHDPKRHIDDRQAESRRILASVNDEMQVSGLANRAGNHFSAADADQNDRIEVIGRRIGRALSLILCLALIFWLIMVIGRSAL